MEEKREQIIAALEAFWAGQTLCAEGGDTVDDLVAAMDSFTASDALEEVEDIVDMELPTGEVIRRGGYESKDQFVNELTQSVLDYVAEHRK
ncbi:hypothetical protein HLB44_35300 [Aquincola sp. S2]|uniref:Acyl carrier protein n=1 Tax=Pseudaquabacterium terrae TaxID=2732868 RepID=A0ABX2EUV5_9BURK|nr:hypothetical protein [Aquabacterium terrae]NRF72265.1 hypothetical protein [Aquabacterium terrae]